MADEGDLYQRISAIAETYEKTDDQPTTVVCSFRVADFDHWRAGYERAVAADSEIRAYRIWRGQDDPNRVVVTESFGSRSYAEAAYNAQATKDAMAADGIDMSSLQFEYFEEAGGWVRSLTPLAAS